MDLNVFVNAVLIPKYFSTKVALIVGFTIIILDVPIKTELRHKRLLSSRIDVSGSAGSINT